MGLPRYSAKRDANEPEIVKAFERLNCKVVKLSMRDIPDLLVSVCKTNVLVEVKDEKAKLKPGQELFHKEWPSHVYVVRNVVEVVALVNDIRSEKCNQQ